MESCGRVRRQEAKTALPRDNPTRATRERTWEAGHRGDRARVTQVHPGARCSGAHRTLRGAMGLAPGDSPIVSASTNATPKRRKPRGGRCRVVLAGRCRVARERRVWVIPRSSKGTSAHAHAAPSYLITITHKVRYRTFAT